MATIRKFIREHLTDPDLIQILASHDQIKREQVEKLGRIRSTEILNDVGRLLDQAQHNEGALLCYLGLMALVNDLYQIEMEGAELA